MKNIKKIIIISLLGVYLPLSLTFAQSETTSNSLAETIGGPAQTMLSNTSINSSFTLGSVVAIILQGALSLLAIIFLIIIVVAGYRWMTASGNEESIKKAQDSIKRAVIGLVIVLMAYAITYFIFNVLPFGGSAGVGGNNGAGGGMVTGG